MWRPSVLVVALAACLSIDEVATPNGDIDLSSDAPVGGAGGASAVRRADATCAGQGWSYVRVAGKDQLPAWSAPDLVPSCGAGPLRLTARAPRMGSVLSMQVSKSTGRVIEATYTSTGTGADGEPWGEYVAPIEVMSVSFGAATVPAEQPFDFAGTILGPFGPVSIAASGCARVRSSGC